MENKRILVAAADYPDLKGKVTLMYIHVRNIFYAAHKIDVTVLNFSAQEDYVIDGIPVITLESYMKQQGMFDILICHAANVRNHYQFLKKYGDQFSKFVFFFHGHEVLRINAAYSKPYPYVQNSRIKAFIQDRYDDFKLAIWHNFYPKVAKKSTFVFVSQWMLDEFLKWTRIPFQAIQDRYMITYNCIGVPFEEATYDWEASKEYDFITIRSNLDGSKYSIDIVNNLAKNNPNMKFLVVGKGEFFKHYPKAENVVWKNQTMRHTEIIEYLQKSRCALMPTRTDAQGLMMCEMASIGIPLITSDIPVCHEVFDDFKNVVLINNEHPELNLNAILQKLEEEPFSKNDKYFNRKTSMAEVNLINQLLEG